MCESAVPTLVALPSDVTAAANSTQNTEAPVGGNTSGMSMSVSYYLLEHVVGGTHLRDRLGMQRFLGGLLMAAWPSSSIDTAVGALRAVNSELASRINNCLTNVVYYEEILG